MDSMKTVRPTGRTTAAALVLVAATGALHASTASAAAAVSCTSPVFARQFYANTTFSGTPKKTDCDSAIDQNWGAKAPVSGLPSNNFGVRWSVTRDSGSGGLSYVGCSESSGLGGCSRFASYRVERWDPAAAAYVTLAEGAAGDAAFHMDTTVNGDVRGLYSYRVVRLDASGAEADIRSKAYGIWDSWL